MIENLNDLFKRSKILILLLMILLSVFGHKAQAQCEIKISLLNVETTSLDLDNASIEVQVEGKGNFISELYKVTLSGKELIQKKAGTGRQNLIFQDLAAFDNYQVLVIFNDEEEVFCKKRKISEISTSIK